MTTEQKKLLAETGKKLQKAFPDFFGFIRFNMAKPRDYTLANLEQCLALEYDGTLIKDLGNRMNSTKYRR
ncbi:hypothetical protein LCGC14_3017390, partial [marine sediment metagenome]